MARDEVLDRPDRPAPGPGHPDRHRSQVLGLDRPSPATYDLNADLLTAATARADAIYTGVLYDALDLATLEGPARGRATRWLAITSSLFGLVRPNDAIPAYRSTAT